MLSLTVLSTLFLALLGSAAAAPTVPESVNEYFNATAGSMASLEKRARATLYTHCTVPNTVALTFDDGPYWYLYDIVKALEAAGAKGTFFVNGNNYMCIYDADNVKRLKYAHDRGHQLASHTWAHKDLATLSWDQVHDEMWRVELALLKTIGVYPAFMRPPYGSYNNMVLDASGIRGQSVVTWDFDSQDSMGASVQTSKNLYTNIINRHPSTILALNHEPYETTAHQVLPFAIQKLQAAGYKLVTLAQCLGKQPYQRTAAPQARDSTWHC